MESSDIIFLFLKKMRLEKYYSKFTSNSYFNIKSIEDCKYVLSNLNYLEEIGLSSAEVNRFKRLYEKAFKESKEEYETQISEKKVTIKSQPLLTQPSTEGSIKGVQIQQKLEIIQKDPISISYKYLNIDGIKSAKIRNELIDSSEWKSLRYFETGYPMVTSPNDYFKLVQEFCEEDFKFVFILPKRLFKYNFNPSSPNKRRSTYTHYQSYLIQISHQDSRSKYEIRIFSSATILRVDELKFECSKKFHLPYSSISINLRLPDQGGMEYNSEDNTSITIDNILNGDFKLYVSVGEYFWEPNYFNSFKFDYYFPITELTPDTLIYTNIYLLFLAREAHLKSSLDIFTSCLGLLQKISCSPPLVYSLRLLFNQKPITLPHKIAIIEGLITTIMMLDRSMKQFDFSCLWCYLKQNTNSSYFKSEQYEKGSTNDILHKEINLDNYRETPHIKYDYTSFRREFFNSESTFFIFQHPIDIYRNYLMSQHCNGLTTIRYQELLIPCVFFGCSMKSDKLMLDYYSPYHGLIPFNSFKVDSPCELEINDYSKILVILDISNDMNNTLDGFNYFPDTISKDNVFYQLDTALFLIEIIIDTLISKNLEYLLGITLVSNDHGFENGYLVFQDLTPDYDFTIQELRKWIRTTTPEIPTKERSSQGGVRLEPLCKKSQGSLISGNSFFSKSARDSKDPMYYFCQFREYVNLTRELLTGTSNPDQLTSFKDVQIHYKNHLSKADDSIKILQNKHLSSNPQYRLMPSILHTISQYLSNPNPFVFIYSVDNDVTNWLLILKFPPNSVLFGSDHIISLTFSKHYLYQPPIFKFLTPILHPNIYTNGKICHPILLEDYDPNTTTLKIIIDSIHSMLCKPIRTHVINRAIGELFLLGTTLYKLQIISVIEIVCMNSLPRRQQEKSLNITLTTSAVTPPKYLLCPLTKELYQNPVISPDGNTFERSAILESLKISQTDPISNNPLTEEFLFPNYAIADCVVKYKMNCVKYSPV
ncbi:hypothetical protein LOD99_407 [Oopsacas minuta]|uniref:Uncharacterized protein n=1 Tax=Oopsacas minuta TaxID=111878 RepID=A0AAV7KC61_9METZ|nr:hypothetical protein LOD99_407 [Oopsacas minuta]